MSNQNRQKLERSVVVHTIIQLLGEAKIHKLDVAFGIKENVLWLQVPICNSLLFM